MCGKTLAWCRKTRVHVGRHQCDSYLLSCRKTLAWCYINACACRKTLVQGAGVVILWAVILFWTKFATLFPFVVCVCVLPYPISGLCLCVCPTSPYFRPVCVCVCDALLYFWFVCMCVSCLALFPASVCVCVLPYPIFGLCVCCLALFPASVCVCVVPYLIFGLCVCVCKESPYHDFLMLLGLNLMLLMLKFISQTF